MLKKQTLILKKVSTRAGGGGRNGTRAYKCNRNEYCVKTLDAKPQGLEFLLQVTGTSEDSELGNSIIKHEFSKYHSDGSTDLWERGSKMICSKAISVPRKNDEDLQYSNSVKESTEGIHREMASLECRD